MKKLILIIVALVTALNSIAQVSPYCFTQASVAYTAITGGSVLGSIANEDQSFVGLPVGFTFNFKGTNFTQFCVNTNGYITLGATDTPYTTYPVSGSNDNNVIAVLGGDIAARTGSSLKYITTGVAPNRVLTVQWLNYTTPFEINSMNFQMRLLGWQSVLFH